MVSLRSRIIPALLWFSHTLTLLVYRFRLVALIVKWLFLHRGSVSKVLHESNDSMSILQFIRLLLLSLVFSLTTMGFSLWQLIMVSRSGLEPWVSWNWSHAFFRDISQVPTTILQEESVVDMWVAWSIYPFAALSFFALFGIKEELVKDCTRWWRDLKKFVVTPDRVLKNDRTSCRGSKEPGNPGSSVSSCRRWDFHDDNMQRNIFWCRLH